ncbi:MAG: ABC transporter ATP-binding protein [Acidobacteria bacterium]|nr:ABC transporter ATP-binding protein [Acidobacteriota bacterium]
MIEAKAATKWFGDLVAVSDVSFRIGAGVTALLGPNGAGKSTMLRMLSGQARPSRGEIHIVGGDPRTDPDVRRRIGIVPQQEAVFEALTALEFVTLSARLSELDDPTSAAIKALEIVELDTGDKRRLPTYSKGMRQRVKIAQCIVHEPDVVLLDEPLTGLDPRQRLAMVELFHTLGNDGMCVLISSHVLEEVERFGSNVLVIAKGRLAAQGDFHAIRALMSDRPLRVLVKAESARALAAALVANEAVLGVRLEDSATISVEAADGGAFGLAIAALAQQVGATLIEVRPLDDDLESVFKYLVNR